MKGGKQPPADDANGTTKRKKRTKALPPPDPPEDDDSADGTLLDAELLLSLISQMKENETLVISNTPLEMEEHEVFPGRKRTMTSPEKKVVKKPRTDEDEKMQGFKELLATKEKELESFLTNQTASLMGGMWMPLKATAREKIIISGHCLETKASVLKKHDELRKNSSEYDKFYPWIESFLKLPVGVVRPIPVTVKNTPDEIKAFLNQAKLSMDKAVTGHETAKEHIVDHVSRIISNPYSRANVLALCGEKGIGKTRLIKKGIAEALNLPMHTINFAGMTDVHALVGHDVTYVSSRFGRIAQILIESSCENPIIYCDELDKVAESGGGGSNGRSKSSDIYGVLTHLLDDEQCHEFYDEYFHGVKLNLSRAIFIASFNDESLIDPILLDRIKVVHLDPPKEDTKVVIVQEHMLPEIMNQLNLSNENVEFPLDIVQYIIKNKVPKEPGCRRLKQSLQHILFRVNTLLLTSEEKKIVVTKELVDSLLKQQSSPDFPHHLYS